MAIKRYLAMTAAEFAGADVLPPKIAWMACHFSPYGTGLSNLPKALPPGSLLILNDRTPICGHDPQVIADQLRECVTTLGCCGVLLDFQRPGIRETAALAAFLTESLPCSAVVSDCYAQELNCPVFLSPVPHHVPMQKHLVPWSGRKIWLDTALDAELIQVTRDGARITALPPGAHSGIVHADEALHCHYSIQVSPEEVLFSLWRTREDLEMLLEEAQALEVYALTGLYQEQHPK